MTGRQDPSPTMMEEGQEGCGGRTEERIPTCGVVWNEAPESAIHSVLTGVVRPMALKDCANRGALAANGAAAGGIPNAGLAAAREVVARAESLGASACATAREAAARAACAACVAGATAATKAAGAARSAGATT